jgi:predicted HicB family RNase H-like nuclease
VAPEVHTAALIAAQARGLSLNQWAAGVLQAATRG